MSGCGHTAEEHSQIIRELARKHLPADEVTLVEAVATAVTLNVMEGVPEEPE